MRIAAAIRVAALVVLAAACSDESTSPVNDAMLNSDVAAITAEAVGQDVEFMHGPGGQWGLGIWGNPGRFDCTSYTGEHVTLERTCTFLDGSGAEQDAYDALTTASASLHVSLTGSFERDDWGSKSFSRVRDVTVTGLEGEETSRTWNGTSSGMLTGVRMHREGETVQMDVTSAGSITDLVVPVPRTATSWPLSGTIAYMVTVSFTGGEHNGESRTLDVSVTFDGTQYATLTVNGETFTIDLASRRCHRGDGGHDDGGGRGGDDGRDDHGDRG